MHIYILFVACTCAILVAYCVISIPGFFGDVLSFCSLSRHSACRCDLLSVRSAPHPNRCAHFIPDDGFFMTETLKYNIFLVKSSDLSVSQCCSQPMFYVINIIIIIIIIRHNLIACDKHS